MNSPLVVSFLTTLLTVALGNCAVTLGQDSIFEQPSHASLPNNQDHGVYSVQWQELGADDPDRAIAFDNFLLSHTVNVRAIDWTGIYAEPFPATVSDTDFVVSIWNDRGNVPDLLTPVVKYSFEGGPIAGVGGSDLTVTPNPGLSPSPTTITTVGGGLAFDYAAPVDVILSPGEYWISIVADQRFDSLVPIVDPEWQWHLADSLTQDGFFAADLTLDVPNAPAFGTHHNGDLAFTIRGTIVPEPAGAYLCLAGLWALCLCFRKHSRNSGSFTGHVQNA